MPTDTVSTEAPVVSADTSSAPSLSDEIGQMFGDLPDSGGESPEPDVTSAEGTTPSEPAAGTETEEGAAPSDGATAEVSDGTTPETPTATPPDESDPFADTTPATFMVNGQPMTNEDIRVFKEGGAVIRPEALPNVLNRLSERESLFERNRAQSQEYQTLAKVTEWTDQSSGKTLTGPEAAIEMRIGNAALLAENKLLIETLTDPAKLYSILSTEEVPDGQGGVTERVILNPTALQALQRENELTRRELELAIRDHFKGVIAESSKPQPPPVNYEAATPELLGQIASQANLDVSVLTAGDKRLLADLLPEHTKDGLASMKWQNLAKSMMKDRAAQKVATQTVVSVTEKAAKEGAARMAAAARGVKPSTRPTAPVPPVRQPTPETSRAQNEDDAWDLQERAAARALQRR